MLTGLGPWKAVATEKYVLAHPVRAAVKYDSALVLRRHLAFDPPALFPTLAPAPASKALTGAAVDFWARQAPSRLPLLLLEIKSGKLLHQLDFAGRGPYAAVATSAKRATVVMEGAAWGLE
jgi:hypothetical protein